MQTLLLIDANSLIHRAFHALPPFTAPDGSPSGALYGLASIFLKLLNSEKEKPEFIAAAFDRPEPTFRQKEFAAYKAHRPPTPPELISQIIASRELLAEFDIKFFEKAGFEADDLIGSLTKKFSENKNLKIIILTSDRDMLQLVINDRVVVETPTKGISENFIYDENAVKEKFGIAPNQLTDYKGLVGDQSDNIPGVKGIGPKTATKFLSEFSNLENLFASIKENHSLYEKISPFKTQALLSKKLATIKIDIPIEIGITDLKFNGLNLQKLTTFFEKLGFQSLLKRLNKNENSSSVKSAAKTPTSSQLSLLEWIIIKKYNAK